MSASFEFTPIKERQVAKQLAVASITLDANNTTESVDVFTVTGVVEVTRLWAEVTIAIGANHTAGHFRVDDGTAQSNISASGVALSALAVGTLVARTGLAAAALALLDNAAHTFEDSGTAGDDEPFTSFIVGKKTGVDTHIEYRYTTTDTPTSGELTVYAEFRPLTGDGNLAAA